MLKQLDGSVAVGEAVAMCRPEVISCYPITPQTHIVEHLSTIVKEGRLPAEFLMVESEFGSLSACIGAAAAGARTYTATSSQGLLFMMEAVYNASGLGLPIVMTLATRAIGAPINIWNDHSDAMSARDSGWIQLFVENNQDAVDVHIQAFRLAEALDLPVMVCMDGFLLTHACARIDMPEQRQVNEFLPPFRPAQVLDPDHPITIGTMVGPEAFMEVRYLAHHKQLQALDLIPKLAAEFHDLFGRDSGGLLKSHAAEDAETVVVAMGCVIGTMKDVFADMRAAGHAIGGITVRSFRPFPRQQLRTMVQHAKRVVVFEKSLAVGLGGEFASNVRWAMRGMSTPVYAIVGGLGGRPVTRPSLRAVFERAIRDELDETTFLDLNMDVVNRQLERERTQQRPGAAALNIVRDLAGIAQRPAAVSPREPAETAGRPQA
jgi:pyruvate ferredoxin oxidoreductase alpha subunit